MLLIILVAMVEYASKKLVKYAESSVLLVYTRIMRTTPSHGGQEGKPRKASCAM